MEKIRRPSGAFPSLPAGIDRLLKLYFDRFRINNELPPELKKYNLSVRLFNNKEKLMLWRNNWKGLRYRDGNILLSGAIDDILEKDGKLIVLDFKTRGYPIKDDTITRYLNQMNIYNLLLRKNGYDTEDYAYLLFYIPRNITNNGIIIFDNELVKVKTSVYDAKLLLERAIKVIRGEIPNASDSCLFCKT